MVQRTRLRLIAWLLKRYTPYRATFSSGEMSIIPVKAEIKKPPVTAGEILERKKLKPFKLHKMDSQMRAEWEAKHNTKEQKHERLVQEIENAGREATEGA